MSSHGICGKSFHLCGFGGRSTLLSLPLCASTVAILPLVHHGMSFDDLKGPLLKTHVRKSVVLNSLFFILGFSAVFVALVASFSLLGGFFGRYQGIIQRIAGLIIIFFGLYIAGVFKIPFLMRSKEIIMLKNKPAGYVGAALIGISFGFAWTPCVGSILGAILALAGTSKGIGGGMILLRPIPWGLHCWGNPFPRFSVHRYFAHGNRNTTAEPYSTFLVRGVRTYPLFFISWKAKAAAPSTPESRPSLAGAKRTAR